MEHSTESYSHIRLLGLSEQLFTVDERGYVRGKFSEYYNALNDLFDLVGVESVNLSRMERMPFLIKNWKFPRPASLRITSTLNIDAFLHRSRIAEEKLRALEGQYDLIMQLHTLLSPGINYENKKYILTTDNTYTMSLKYRSGWLPDVSMKEHQKWIDLEKSVYQNAKYIFAWSSFVRESLVNDYGVSPDRAIVMGVGANFYDESFIPAGYNNQTALFVGKEFERKGGFVILKAWEKVIKALPNAKLQIVGPKDKSKILQRGGFDDLPKGVEWVGRVDNRESLEKIFKQASVFVMPSLYEPYGLVFKEAMGIGLSCIGANCCAMPEFIIPDQTGMLAEPGDSDDLAEKLIQVLGDPNYAEMLGKNSYDLVKSKYTWPIVIDNVKQYVIQAYNE